MKEISKIYKIPEGDKGILMKALELEGYQVTPHKAGAYSITHNDRQVGILANKSIEARLIDPELIEFLEDFDTEMVP